MRLYAYSALILLTYLPLSPLQGCGDNGDDDDTSIDVDGQEREPNDGPEEATELLLGQTLEGTMSTLDVDYFSLEIPRDFNGYKITIDAVDFDGRCFTGVDPNLEIFAADGSTSLYWSEDSLEDYCPRVSFSVTQEALYYVKVGTGYDLNGTYYLTAEEGGPGTVSGTVTYGASRKEGLGASEQSEAWRRGPMQRTQEPTGDLDTRDEPEALMPIMPGELLIQPGPEVSLDGLADRLASAFEREVRLVRPVVAGRFALLEVPLRPGLTASEARRSTLDWVIRARTVQGMARVEPNRIYEPSVVPDDADWESQWALQDEWGIRAPEGWETTTGSMDTVVAIIDTGHDSDHPDLVAKSLPGYDFITYADSANDGDGPDSDPSDSTYNGHGTHVAGIVAAATNNGEGVAGVGWDVAYLPLRVCGNFGCTEADLLEAVWHAGGFETVAGPSQEVARAQVINLSLGGDDYCSTFMQDAVWAVSGRGVVVVAAAGNQGEDAMRHSPANCEQVIAVGATDSGGVRAGFSNYGSTIDLMAPGVSILSTYEGNDYATLSGTSMASPHVAGLAALIKDLNPTLHVDTVRELMTSTARAVDCNGALDGCGAGLIDVEAALLATLAAPDDVGETLVLVQAVDVADSSRVFQSVVHEGAFFLAGLDPGVFTIQVGEDLDGDFVLGEEGEAFAQSPEPVEITALGEDVGVGQLVLQ